MSSPPTDWCLSRPYPDDSLGCMLELSWGGTRPVSLGGGIERAFLEDGDIVTFRGFCQGNGFRVGFGDCTGRVLPARPADE